MQAVKVGEELWASSMLPQGVFERWRAGEHESVRKGQALAEVRIEDALHEILSPADGLCVHSAQAGDVVQPGELLGWVASSAEIVSSPPTDRSH